MEYYRDPQVTIYQGDARNVLAQLPEHSVDAVLCSPPSPQEGGGDSLTRSARGLCVRVGCALSTSAISSALLYLLDKSLKKCLLYIHGALTAYRLNRSPNLLRDRTMPLAGEAKKNYQRDYMRKRRSNVRPMRIVRPTVLDPVKPTKAELQAMIHSIETKAIAPQSDNIPLYDSRTHKAGDTVRKWDGRRYVVVTVPEIDADSNIIW